MRRTRLELWLATTALVAVAAGLPLSAPAIAEESTPVASPGVANSSTPTVTPDTPADGGQRDVAAPVADTAPTPNPAAAVTANTPAADTPAAGTPTADAPAADAPAAANTPAADTPPAATAPEADTAPAAVAQPGATPETAPPAATAVELTLDQRVAEKIHEMFGGKIERILGKNKTAVEAFYTVRNFAPIWMENGVENAHAKAAASYLAGVSVDGLDPADYVVPSFANADAAALAEAELRFTATVLTYARHAQIGRVHYSRVSADIAYNLVAPEPGEVLAKLADAAADVAGVLDSFNPPHAGYRALKAKLAEVRSRTGEQPRARIDSGRTLKVGMEDPRVPLVREYLGVTAEGAGTVYDKALSEAVKAFQRQHDLPATGLLTSATVEALNGPRHDHDADIIIANMERWRWLPRDLGSAYVMVNIPDYTLRVMNHDQLVWTTKIVAGKPGEKATPLLSETMKYITINPTWNVPPSIINNEYLPALERDPTVLDRMGLRVERNRDGSIHIYQPPGDGNALGRIRFNFPNKFLVYQHDTPDKHLFSQARRAFSHGCMRVQFPDKYAEVLLDISNPKDGYTVDRIHHMYGTGERDIHLDTPIPVHITYQTAFVDDAGHLVFREDVYGRDAKLLAALKGDERRVADVPVDHRDPGNGGRRQASRLPPPPQQQGYSLFNFFR